MIRRVANPPNPFTGQSTEWFDVPPAAGLEVFEEQAKSIISENKSPDIGFRFSVNPYRGCFHGCSYCYARPTHQYLDFGAGTDFEKKIVVKMNAPDLLAKAFAKKSWNGDRIIFSGVTDCYQPLENSYELTKRCLEVCLRYKNPVGIITKGALIQRDVDLLHELNAVAGVHVHISLAFADAELARKFEPHTPSPAARLRAMKILTDAGIRVGVSVSPMIPGISETEIPRVIELAAAAGATSAFATLLRLPAEVAPVFFERMEESYPERAKKIMNGLRNMKGGQLNRSQFGQRMVGSGPQWEALEWLFRTACEKHSISFKAKERNSVELVQEPGNDAKETAAEFVEKWPEKPQPPKPQQLKLNF